MFDSILKAIVTVGAMAILLATLAGFGFLDMPDSNKYSVPNELAPCMLEYIEVITNDRDFNVVYSYCEAEYARRKTTLERN